MRRLAATVLLLLASNVCAAETLRLAVAALPVGLGNPYFDTILPRALPASALYDSLTIMDRGGELGPGLAARWQSLDELTWVFELRPDIVFSNGETLTAAAIVEALEHLKTPAGNRYAVTRELAAIERVEPGEGNAVIFKTNRPEPLLPRFLAGFRIPAPGHFAKLGAEAFAQDPVGSGPFKLVSWQPAKVTFERNPSAWRQAGVARLEILLIPDQSARLQALLSGAVDIALGLGPNDGDQLESRGGHLQVDVGGRVMTLSFVTNVESPLQDPRVRLALNHAVNRQLIVDALYGGATVPASQAIPRQAFGYDSSLEPIPYDPARARQLLAEAGYESGFALTATVSINNGAGDGEAYQAIAADLAAVGVDLTLAQVPLSKLVEYIYEGGWPGLAFGMDYGTEPALDGLRPFLLHSCLWARPWHCDEDQIPLIRRAQETFDLDERRQLVRQIVANQRRTLPGILLWELPRFDGVGPRVLDYQRAPGFIPLETIRLKSR